MLQACFGSIVLEACISGEQCAINLYGRGAVFYKPILGAVFYNVILRAVWNNCLVKSVLQAYSRNSTVQACLGNCVTSSFLEQ